MDRKPKHESRKKVDALRDLTTRQNPSGGAPGKKPIKK